MIEKEPQYPMDSHENPIKNGVKFLFEYDVKGRDMAVLLCDLGKVTARSSEIGINSTGIQSLFHQINAYSSSALCDIADISRTGESGTLSISPEGYVSGDKKLTSPSEYDLLGFSIVNVNQTFDFLEVLEASGIPMFSDERDEKSPLVVVGGASAINPMPLGLFADIIIMGQGEEAILQCTEVMAKGKREGKSKSEILEGIKIIEGVYVPSAVGEKIDFAEIDYKNDKYPPGSIMVMDGKASIIISRSCPYECAFCRLSSSQHYQKKSYQQIMQHLSLLQAAGAKEVAIVSASASAWRSGDMNINDIIKATQELGMTPKSLADRPEQIGFGNQNSVVLAPETSPKLRKEVLNKSIKEEALREAVVKALTIGVNKFTFYGILGIKGETEEDLGYFNELAAFTLYQAELVGATPPTIEFNVMPLMPSPHTQLETFPMVSWDDFRAKIEKLNEAVPNQEQVKFYTHLSELDYYLEAILNRGTIAEGRLCFDAYRHAKHHEVSYLQALKEVIVEKDINIEDYLQAREIAQLPYKGIVQPTQKRKPRSQS